MNHKQKTKILVIGNEKGGAGKTTCAMHLIAGLLHKQYKVISIDADSRQGSLTSYILNRSKYNINNQNSLLESTHFHIKESTKTNDSEIELDYNNQLENIISQADNIDYIVIDTPGSYTYLSRLTHSLADVIITPVNDSFVDLDVIAKIDSEKLTMIKPSIYSQMIWEQKLTKAKRDGSSIKWLVLRNRLSSLDAINKRKVLQTLEILAKRIDFKVISGFSERVIFRELFLNGLTLLDLTSNHKEKTLNSSHILARQELRSFLQHLLEEI